MTLTRLQWALWSHVITGVAIAGLGLGEALVGDVIGSSRLLDSLGSTFRLVVFAVAIVLGFGRLWRLRRPLAVSALGAPLPGSEIAGLARTAGVVAAGWLGLAVGVVVGLLLPSIGAAFGGFALGAASCQAWAAVKLERIERREGMWVLYRISPRWLRFGREPAGDYFRVAATPLSESARSLSV